MALNEDVCKAKGAHATQNELVGLKGLRWRKKSGLNIFINKSKRGATPGNKTSNQTPTI